MHFSGYQMALICSSKSEYSWTIKLCNSFLSFFFVRRNTQFLELIAIFALCLLMDYTYFCFHYVWVKTKLNEFTVSFAIVDLLPLCAIIMFAVGSFMAFGINVSRIYLPTSFSFLIGISWINSYSILVYKLNILIKLNYNNMILRFG